jgi:hypothetical protein
MAPRCAKDARRQRRCGGFSVGQQRAQDAGADVEWHHGEATRRRAGDQGEISDDGEL